MPHERTAATTLATTIPGEHVRIAVNKDTEPFWQAAKESRLAAPQCTDCGTFRLPPDAVLSGLPIDAGDLGGIQR